MKIYKFSGSSVFDSVRLVFLFNEGDKCWEIGEDIDFELTNGDVITVPKGFKTDLATVPKLVRPVINTYGDFLLGVIIHDWIYSTDYKRKEMGDYKNRLFADEQFRFFALKFDTNKLRVNTMYYSIRAFGRSIYKRKSLTL